MRSKTPLALIEQVIMVLVFAVASAICLRAFVSADHLSKTIGARDQAVLRAECAAEALKHTGGDLNAAAAQLGGTVSGDVWTIGYDADWQIADAPDLAYVLTASPAASNQAGLGFAQVVVCDADQTPLFSLTAAWQEALS